MYINNNIHAAPSALRRAPRRITCRSSSSSPTPLSWKTGCCRIKITPQRGCCYFRPGRQLDSWMSPSAVEKYFFVAFYTVHIYFICVVFIYSSYYFFAFFDKSWFFNPIFIQMSNVIICCQYLMQSCSELRGHFCGHRSYAPPTISPNILISAVFHFMPSAQFFEIFNNNGFSRFCIFLCWFVPFF